MTSGGIISADNDELAVWVCEFIHSENKPSSVGIV